MGDNTEAKQAESRQAEANQESRQAEARQAEARQAEARQEAREEARQEARQEATEEAPSKVWSTEAIRRVLTEDLGMSTCEDMYRQQEYDLQRLGVKDAETYLKQCNVEFDASVRRLSDECEGMSRKTMITVLKAARAQMESTTKDLELRLREALKNARANETQEEKSSILQRVKSYGWSALKVTGATVAGAAAGVLSAGDTSDKVVRGVAGGVIAGGVVAVFEYLGIDPITWIIVKVKQAWRNPSWAAQAIARFNAIKRVACRLMYALVLRMTSFAIGHTTQEQSEYEGMRMQDFDLQTGSLLCSIIRTAMRGVMADPDKQKKIISAGASVVGGIAMAGVQAIPGPWGTLVSTGMGKLVEAVGDAKDTAAEAARGMFEVVMMERTLTASLEEVADMLDPSCFLHMFPYLMLLRDAACKYKYDNVETPVLPDQPPKPPDPAASTDSGAKTSEPSTCQMAQERSKRRDPHERVAPDRAGGAHTRVLRSPTSSARRESRSPALRTT